MKNPNNGSPWILLSRIWRSFSISKHDMANRVSSVRCIIKSTYKQTLIGAMMKTPSAAMFRLLDFRENFCAEWIQVER